MDKIILVDWGSTLVKADIIGEANIFRANILQRMLPGEEEHAHPEKLYENNRAFVEKRFGIMEDMEFSYRQNHGDIITITGTEFQNQIATNLFQCGMLMAAHKHKEKIFPEGFIDVLKDCKKAGYKLAIVSGIRNDIISGMLEIAKCPVEFDYIFGQPPILGISNEENMKTLSEKGEIAYVIGDKLSDLQPAKKFGAKAIFVTWGHPTGGEEDLADHKIDSAKELADIIPLKLNGN